MRLEAGTMPALFLRRREYKRSHFHYKKGDLLRQPRHIGAAMDQVKDTLRALVRIGYDGRVYKTFRGPKAQERFDTEVKVLRHLEDRGCNFVPRLLDSDPESLRIVTTNCGSRVDHLDDKRRAEIFAELLPFGVRHDDAETRNVTYRQADGRFCLIDFEFATILDEDGPQHQ